MGWERNSNSLENVSENKRKILFWRLSHSRWRLLCSSHHGRNCKVRNQDRRLSQLQARPGKPEGVVSLPTGRAQKPTWFCWMTFLTLYINISLSGNGGISENRPYILHILQKCIILESQNPTPSQKAWSKFSVHKPCKGWTKGIGIHKNKPQSSISHIIKAIPALQLGDGRIIVESVAIC